MNIHKMLEKSTQSRMTPSARAACIVSSALLKPSMDGEKTSSVSTGKRHSHEVQFETSSLRLLEERASSRSDDEDDRDESAALLDHDLEKGEHSDQQPELNEAGSPKKSHWQIFVDILWMLLNVFSTVTVVFLNKM